LGSLCHGAPRSRGSEAVPELGQSVEGLPWRIFMSDSAHVNFVPDYTTVDAPREIYGATWVFSADERVLTLGLGPDDGARAWLNGDQGGGWGTYARFLDEDGPVADLELSLSSGGAWDFDQTDSDGDGIGDVCEDD
jgi:hypothetical protein